VAFSKPLVSGSHRFYLTLHLDDDMGASVEGRWLLVWAEAATEEEAQERIKGLKIEIEGEQETL
jgi:hypothetical protein